MTENKSKSKTGDHWLTPEKILEPVRRFAGGRVALDPCSNPDSTVGAEREWYGPPNGIDGRVAPWIADGLIFVNPPYSEKAFWSKRCHDYWRAHQEIIELIPADTDTHWFHDYCWTAPVRCFLRGRVPYVGDRSYGARFPSVLVYYGFYLERFEEVFSEYGHCA